MQVLGARQSASVEQVVRQATRAASHTYGVHDWLVVPAHVPLLSQVPAAVNIEPVQPPAWQMTPAPNRAHEPVPSHTPVRPHIAAVSVGQRPPGFVPAEDGRQVPSAPGDTQVKQASAHAVSQQTPSAQNSDAHSEPAVQGSPGCLAGGRSAPPVPPLPPPPSPVTGMSRGASSLGPASCVRISPAPPQAESSSKMTGIAYFPPIRTPASARFLG